MFIFILQVLNPVKWKESCGSLFSHTRHLFVQQTNELKYCEFVWAVTTYYTRVFSWFYTHLIVFLGYCIDVFQCSEITLKPKSTETTPTQLKLSPFSIMAFSLSKVIIILFQPGISRKKVYISYCPKWHISLK